MQSICKFIPNKRMKHSETGVFMPCFILRIKLYNVLGIADDFCSPSHMFSHTQVRSFELISRSGREAIEYSPRHHCEY